MSEMCRVSWKAVVVLSAELVMKLGNEAVRITTDWLCTSLSSSFTSCSVLLTHRPEHRFICWDNIHISTRLRDYFTHKYGSWICFRTNTFFFVLIVQKQTLSTQDETYIHRSNNQSARSDRLQAANRVASLRSQSTIQFIMSWSFALRHKSSPVVF